LLVLVIDPRVALAQTTHPIFLEKISLGSASIDILDSSSQISLNSGNLIASRPVPRRSGWEAIWRALGLGRRGSCSNVNIPLISISPSSHQNSTELIRGLEIGSVLTTEAYPTFWLYIPPELSNVDFAEFIIQDEDITQPINDPILIRLENKTGIVSFTLPSQEKPLRSDHHYYWYFSTICDLRRPSRNINIEGAIERKDAETLGISKQLDVAYSDKERLDIYSSRNVWNETLTLTAELICKNPKDKEMEKYWDSLLQDIDKQLKSVMKKEDYRKIETVKMLHCSNNKPQTIQAIN
jgi:hypothetical protein